MSHTSFTSMPSPGSISCNLEGTETVRLVFRVPTKLLDSEDYRTSAYGFLSALLPGWEDNKEVLFRAVSVRSCPENNNRAMCNMIIDVKNHGYDLGTAHRDMTILPVYLVTPKKNEQGFYKTRRMRHRDEQLAFRLASLHGTSGSTDQIPLLEDDSTRRKISAKWSNRSRPQTQTRTPAISTLDAAGRVVSRISVLDAIAMALSMRPERKGFCSDNKTLKID